MKISENNVCLVRKKAIFKAFVLILQSSNLAQSV